MLYFAMSCFNTTLPTILMCNNVSDWLCVVTMEMFPAPSGHVGELVIATSGTLPSECLLYFPQRTNYFPF